jgi:hypothetical protein
MGDRRECDLFHTEFEALDLTEMCLHIGCPLLDDPLLQNEINRTSLPHKSQTYNSCDRNTNVLHTQPILFTLKKLKISKDMYGPIFLMLLPGSK